MRGSVRGGASSDRCSYRVCVTQQPDEIVIISLLRKQLT